jgi:integrase
MKLTYDPIARWRRDSRSTTSFNARYVILQRFLKHEKTTVKKLLRQASKTPPGKPQVEIEEMIERFLDYRADMGNASSTVAKEGGIIISFLKANNVMVRIGKKYTLHTVYESRRVLTQPEIEKMIAFHQGLEQRAVIYVEAQTAQRIGILTGLKWSMIHRYPAKGKVYGVVEVMPEIADRNGNPVNKTQTKYNFGLHWQSMKILDELKEQRKDDDPFIFKLDKRRMQEAITDAAEGTGIQVEIERKLKVVKKDKKGKKTTKKRKWHEIHAHVFRRFFMHALRQAGIQDRDLMNSLIGHRIQAQGTYDVFPPKDIVKVLVKADKQLKVLLMDQNT